MIKQWIKRSVLMVLMCSVTSGCMMYRLEELRSTTPSGSAFQIALSKLYMDFATQEEKNYDWQNSWYFADKGLMLAYGKDVGPEELEGWNLDADGRMQLEKARIRVMDTLTPALKAGAPTRAAAIQFNFDCWVEQQEEGWQADDIDQCRTNLMHALNGGKDLTVAPKPMQVSKPAATPKAVTTGGDAEKTKNVMPDKPAAKKDVVAETASYAVFFDAGKADVSAPGKNVLNEVVGSVKGKSDYAVILHTAPLTGAAAQEKDLLSKRISVVKKALVDGGVNENAIVSAGTPDASKPVARRIELFLNE